MQFSRGASVARKRVTSEAVAGTDFVDAGKRLRMLQDSDPDEFAREATESGVGLRKAYYLVEIDRAFDGLNVPKERMLKIGWTKLQLLAAHVTAQNYRTLLDQAEAHSVHELQSLLAGKPASEDKHCVLLYLTKSEFEILARVVVSHGGRRNGRSLQDKEKALIAALRALPAKQ